MDRAGADMRRGAGIATVWAAMLGLALLLGGALEAAAQPLPAGSYLRSCRDARIERGRDLVAVCRVGRTGPFIPARLPDVFQCRGDIANIEGTLWCERRPGPPPGPPPGPRPGPPPGPPGFGPPGSYRASCVQVDQRGSRLFAQCRTRFGDWVPAMLNLQGCQPGGDIRNDDGRLVCRSFPLPPGSYLQTCRNVLATANWLSAECRTVSGGWRESRMSFSSCGPRPNIINMNGQLVCR